MAIKLLAPTSTSTSWDWAAAFRHEVRVTAKLHHPNVVCLIDPGELPPDLGIPGLRERAAYLAMNRTERTLDAVASEYRWPAIYEVLGRRGCVVVWASWPRVPRWRARCAPPAPVRGSRR